LFPHVDVCSWQVFKMLFAFSALDILSAVTTASRCCFPLNQEMRQLHQGVQELKLTLDGLVEAYKPTGLKYVFLRRAFTRSDRPK
jgi:hypothetical protein